MKRVLILLALAVAALAVVLFARSKQRLADLPNLAYIPHSADLPAVRRRVGPTVRTLLAQAGADPGAPVHIRIFKESRELEVWARARDQWRRVKTYPICAWSGDLGPKLREGDGQAPEGLYRVDAGLMNPASRYHLAFNLGFPNALDRANGRTGSFLMVHGACMSIGCFAMTDAGIEEIYLMVEAALAAGQKAVAVHAFPFRMTDERLARIDASPHREFWLDLAQAAKWFETRGEVPDFRVENRRYRIVPPQTTAGG